MHHTHEGSIGNLCNDRIESLMRQVVDGFNFSVMEQAERSLLGRAYRQLGVKELKRLRTIKSITEALGEQ